jgi:predicted 3-demethylubiquinone-9 3-methyltransferase (glyoxalase superfamily)
MKSIRQLEAPKIGRVECVAPNCGLMVSMITATSEGWIKIVPATPGIGKERSHIGWCRKCKDKYGVSE